VALAEELAVVAGVGGGGRDVDRAAEEGGDRLAAFAIAAQLLPHGERVDRRLVGGERLDGLERLACEAGDEHLGRDGEVGGFGHGGVVVEQEAADQGGLDVGLDVCLHG